MTALLHRDRPNLTFNLANLRLLDRAIRRRYTNWVRDAPATYTQDNFFKERVPTVVTSRYGQNQELGMDWEQETANWTRDRDFSRVRYLTVALATHLRYVQVTVMLDVDRRSDCLCSKRASDFWMASHRHRRDLGRVPRWNI